MVLIPGSFLIVDTAGEMSLKIIDPGKILQTNWAEESLFHDLVLEIRQESHDYEMSVQDQNL
jgi:hypothetical protein